MDHTLFADPIDTHHMDCMSRKVNIKKFCLSQRKIFKSPFLRGYINIKMKEAVCEAGTAMRLSVSCQEKLELCKNEPKKSCLNLKGLYAHDLEMNYANKTDEKLNCFFAMKSEIDYL